MLQLLFCYSHQGKHCSILPSQPASGLKVEKQPKRLVAANFFPLWASWTSLCFYKIQPCFMGQEGGVKPYKRASRGLGRALPLLCPPWESTWAKELSREFLPAVHKAARDRPGLPVATIPREPLLQLEQGAPSYPRQAPFPNTASFEGSHEMRQTFSL